MSERDELLAAIISEPQDDVVRLVFADWLEEHGEADRAEFIRIQIELARRADFTTLEPHPSIGGFANRSSHELNSRATQLLAANEDNWRSEFPHLGRLSEDFERGFVESCNLNHIAGGSPVQMATDFITTTPGRSLIMLVSATGFSDTNETIEGEIHRIECIPMVIEYVFENYFPCFDPASIRQLVVRGSSYGYFRELPTQFPEVAAKQLTHLTVNECNVRDAFPRLFAHEYVELLHLEISACRLNDEDVGNLFRVGRFPKLRSLGLANNLFGAPAVEAIVGSSVFSQLVSLDLSDCVTIGPDAALVLLRSRLPEYLRHVGLSDTAIPIQSRQQIEARMSRSEKQSGIVHKVVASDVSGTQRRVNLFVVIIVIVVAIVVATMVIL